MTLTPLLRSAASNYGCTWEEGRIVYVGDLHQGRWHGSGTQMDREGRVLYRGGWAGGRREGVEGQSYWPTTGHVSCKGPFHGGSPSGAHCSLYDEQGRLTYEGALVHGALEGQGVRTLHDDAGLSFRWFTGTFRGGLLHGEHGLEHHLLQGVRVCVYEGGHTNGSRQGQGRETCEGGVITYEGGYARGLRHGHGRLLLTVNASGLTHAVGDFAEGTFVGGRLVLADGTATYEGPIDKQFRRTGLGCAWHGQVGGHVVAVRGTRERGAVRDSESELLRVPAMGTLAGAALLARLQHDAAGSVTHVSEVLPCGAGFTYKGEGLADWPRARVLRHGYGTVSMHGKPRVEGFFQRNELQRVLRVYDERGVLLWESSDVQGLDATWDARAPTGPLLRNAVGRLAAAAHVGATTDATGRLTAEALEALVERPALPLPLPLGGGNHTAMDVVTRKRLLRGKMAFLLHQEVAQVVAGQELCLVSRKGLAELLAKEGPVRNPCTGAPLLRITKVRLVG